MDQVICSVIIAVYNGADYIRECLCSILGDGQYNDIIEIIVVDDGSTDHTLDIIRSSFENIRNIKVIHQQNAGQASARNRGMKVAQGKYLLFVDADDVVSDYFWKDIIPLIEKDQYDVIYFGMHQFTGINKPQIREYEGIEKKVIEIMPQEMEHLKACTLYYDSVYGNRTNPLYGINVSITWGSCWRRSIQSKGNIWWNNDVLLHQDGIFNLKMLHSCEHGVYVRIPCYFYRIHGNASSSRVWDHAEKIFERRNQAALYILQNMYGLTLKDVNSEYIQRYNASLIFQIGVLMERDIFSRKAALRFQQKKQRMADVKKAYGSMETVYPAVLSPHEKKIYSLYKKPFIFIYLFFFATRLYHTVGGLIKGRNKVFPDR